MPHCTLRDKEWNIPLLSSSIRRYAHPVPYIPLLSSSIRRYAHPVPYIPLLSGSIRRYAHPVPYIPSLSGSIRRYAHPVPAGAADTNCATGGQHSAAVSPCTLVGAAPFVRFRWSTPSQARGQVSRDPQRRLRVACSGLNRRFWR